MADGPLPPRTDLLPRGQRGQGRAELPHSTEAERHLIAGALIWGVAVLDAAAPLVSADDFYSESFRSVWQACQRLKALREPPTVPTVAGELLAGHCDLGLDDLGGEPALVAMTRCEWAPLLPTPAFYESSARLVRRYADQRRRIAEALADVNMELANPAARKEVHRIRRRGNPAGGGWLR